MRGPLGVVGGRQAVIGHHRTRKEEGVHRAIRGAVHACMPDLPGGDEDNRRSGAQEEFNLRAATNRLQGASDNGDVPEGEVKRGEQRKRPGNQLDCVAVIKPMLSLRVEKPPSDTVESP